MEHDDRAGSRVELKQFFVVAFKFDRDTRDILVEHERLPRAACQLISCRLKAGGRRVAQVEFQHHSAKQLVTARTHNGRFQLPGHGVAKGLRKLERDAPLDRHRT